MKSLMKESLRKKGHIYEIVVAEFNNNLVKLNILQEKFGPFLLRECNNIFQKMAKRVRSTA